MRHTPMKLCPFAFVLSLALSLPVGALAQERNDLAHRYAGMTRCMERSLGMDWYKKYDIALQVNRWGAEEPSEHDIDSAPQAVRMVDLRCRRELQLAGQPRP